MDANKHEAQQKKVSVLTREEYFAERRHALNEQFKSTISLIISLITLSSGVLIMSFKSVTQIAGGNKICDILLILSWLYFSAVILTCVLSLYLNQKGAQKYIIELDRSVSGNRTAYAKRIRSYQWVKWLNFISVIGFFNGVISLAAFYYIYFVI